MTTARKSKAPITVPAMAPIEAPPEEAGCEELADGAALVVLAGFVGLGFDVWVAVGDAAVDEGESPFKQDRSSELATSLGSVAPPCRQRASTIMKMMEVPCSTFAVQEN